MAEDQVQEFEDMFVLVKCNNKEKELLVYSMRDSSAPIIKCKEMPLLSIDLAFVVNQENENYSFVLQSAKSQRHCEIKWKRGDSIIIN